MRGGTNKPKTRVQHHYQHFMRPNLADDAPARSFYRMRNAFNRALPTTKRWAMAVDFQNNVNAALEREKNEK